MKKKCKICNKFLDIKVFTFVRFSKTHNKYLRSKVCNGCHWKKPSVKKARQKWQSKGYYGWTIGLEENLKRDDSRFKGYSKMRYNEWESQIANMETNLSKRYDIVSNFQKNLEKKDEKTYLNYKKLVIKERLKQRQKLDTILDNIVGSIFYYILQKTGRNIKLEFKKSFWDWKIKQMSKHHRYYN